MKQSAIKISKSAVMKRAWSIFKSGHSFYSSSFSASLEKVWEVEKANVEYKQEQEKIAKHEAWYKENEEAIRSAISSSIGCNSSYYVNGAYSGD